MTDDDILPLGKIPPLLLESLLARAPLDDPSVLVGPEVGLDCAVVEAGDDLLVMKTDPITFVTDALGYYLVQVNANDIATTGARARWLLLTLLLPQRATTAAALGGLMDDVGQACRQQGISLIGGHTEITQGLTRPIAVGTLIGTVSRTDLVTPKGACVHDRVLLTKTVPVEGVSILARERAGQLLGELDETELLEARNYLYDPGISIVTDARIALRAGRVSAMHDPTEGGLMSGLWELAHASGRSLHIDISRIPVSALAARVCASLAIDPLATMASGALLLTAAAADAAAIGEALRGAGIACTDIGTVGDGPAAVYDCGAADDPVLLERPQRDEIARLFEHLE